MKKAKERIDAEASINMTKKQKMDNFWFYYKWWIIGGAVTAGLLGMFIYDMVTQVHPDYQIGLLTPGYMGDDTRMELEALLSKQVEDRNGDGKAVVAVMVYNIGLSETDVTDPMIQMASITRLSADLQGNESLLFLTDRPVEYYKQNGEMFAYNDGTMAPEGAEPEESKLGVPLKDCPLFDEFMAKDRLEKMSEFRLVKRAVAPSMEEKKPELKENRKVYDALFDKLTATAQN